MKTAVLFANQVKPETRRWVARIRGLLSKRGVKTLEEPRSLDGVDFAVAVGGDGTMLRAARTVAPHGVPLVGINTGGLGFLSGTETDELERDVQAIVEGKFPVQERWMLAARGFRGERSLFGPALALNDLVIRPSREARAFYLKATLGGEYLTDYFGDGLIVSTPTGSTAYALAAMGPIVEPGLDVLLLAPICPHALTQRPLVLPFDLPLSIEVRSRRPREALEVLVSMDGQFNRPLRAGDRVEVRRYEKPFKLLTNPKRSYFELLRTKLHWGTEARGWRK